MNAPESEWTALGGGQAERRAREILLVAHPGRSEITETAHRVAKIFDEAGIGLRVLEDEAYSTRFDLDDAGEADGYPVRVMEHGPGAAVGCEMVLALGGDGTFLRAAELARDASVPVLGINLGRIGFLTEAEVEHLDDALSQVVRRDYTLEERMTIDVCVQVDDVVVERGWALNEASIENATRMGVLEVVLEVDGRPVSSFGCDGVLIATPTGSTAYAFSAGGPVVWPELEALLVIPSNAHALFARPLVTSPDSLIAVETVATGHDAIVFLDGRRTLALPRGGRVEAVRGTEPVRWVRLDSAPFADRMVRKFQLPVTGWRGRRRMESTSADRDQD
ncbi:NAD kinase [Nocardia sp. 2]|uniref:NAD kinase n=1 Tax=Nocardia acididurans TaxID=2802282 RepID=A0ABS1M2B7_9NOCA|nr:NAD kinase [Nocardia acididurans]MBL1074359.1 NAD kinase [Nocardia acididurans]